MANKKLTLANLSVHAVTKMPRTRPSYNEDGVFTGWYITLHQSIALGVDDKPRIIPAGCALTRGTSSGMDAILGVCVVRPRIGNEYSDVRFRA
jgi:hypothetical protein